MSDRVKDVLAGDLIEYVRVYHNKMKDETKIILHFYLAVANARRYENGGFPFLNVEVLNLETRKIHEQKIYMDWSGAIYRNGEPVYYSYVASERDRILRKNANK